MVTKLDISALMGAVAGAALGSSMGSPGLVVGTIVGIMAGFGAGFALERDDERKRLETAELEDDAGAPSDPEPLSADENRR
jgi:phage tail tape-measure protein